MESKKHWQDLLPNQRKWALINTLQHREISFFFVCSQDVKERFFALIKQENADYDMIRQEMYKTYTECLKNCIYAGKVKNKLKAIKRLLYIEV
jgi:hypothetical protein